jgi:glutamate-1-semialdehyde 2,1-aminomutase
MATTAAPSILDRYLARTPRSRALFERAAAVLPGGSTRTTVFAQPYPPYLVAGQGAYVTDADGNRYLDALGNYTALILGHAHPAVVAAVEDQVRRGSAFAAPTEAEILLAEELRRRLPSLELVRFTTSGTEATMFAIRAARAHTGRGRIVLFDHFYHGTHDAVLPGTPGVPAATSVLTTVVPWGDPAALEAALAGHEDEVAAIVVEPVQGAGGIRPADPAFLAFLRDYTRRHRMVLVFDEVISFRVGPGGAQGRLGVEPDLTTLGKIIGGGYPLAAFGGREEIMRQFDARRPDHLVHGGTYNGHPVAAVAGLATLRELTPDRYAHLEALGERLRGRLVGELPSTGLAAEVLGIASLFQVRLTGPHAALQSELYLALLCAGIAIAPRGMGALSVPMTEAEVDQIADAIVAVATELTAGRPDPSGWAGAARPGH